MGSEVPLSCVVSFKPSTKSKNEVKKAGKEDNNKMSEESDSDEAEDDSSDEEESDSSESSSANKKKPVAKQGPAENADDDNTAPVVKPKSNLDLLLELDDGKCRVCIVIRWCI